MRVSLLDATAVAWLKEQPFTYAETGRTRGPAPDGFHPFARSATLSPGVDFRSAARALLRWQVQARAGLVVAASVPTVEPDAVVLMRLGLGRFSIRIPCRVVYVIDEPAAQGFAYGTLPGHPESGEEAFVLRQEPDGAIRFEINAFSRPASRLAKLGGPASSRVQHLMTSRYLSTLDG